MVCALGGGIVCLAAMAVAVVFNWLLVLTAAVLAVVLVLFHRLTVAVTDSLVRISFGPGLIRKQFRLEEIVECRPVRNRWWYGWGIKYTPHGWLYNVSGLRAVELRMRNGRTCRIGTDEPSRLSDAIRRAASAVPAPGR